MGKVYTGAQNFGSSFHIGSSVPIDDRFVVATKSDLTVANNWKVNGIIVAYKGMAVACEDTGRLYVYKGEKTDAALANIANWFEAGDTSNITTTIKNAAKNAYLSQKEVNEKFNAAIAGLENVVSSPLNLIGTTDKSADILTKAHAKGDVYIWNGSKTTLREGDIVEPGDMIVFTAANVENATPFFSIIQKNFELSDYAKIGTDSDTKDSDTIKGAKKYADNVKTEVVGTDSDAATADTIKGAKKAVSDLSTTTLNATYDNVDNYIGGAIQGTVGNPTLSLSIGKASYNAETKTLGSGLVDAATLASYVGGKTDASTAWLEL